MTKPEVCPVCSGGMTRLDIPNKNLYLCDGCSELGQLLDTGTMSRLDPLLAKNNLGDDRVRAAISEPHVATVERFIDIIENLKRTYEMGMASASGGLRTVLAQAENRQDNIISYLTGEALVSEKATTMLRAAMEVRDALSQGAKAARGIGDGSSSTHSAEG